MTDGALSYIHSWGLIVRIIAVHGTACAFLPQDTRLCAIMSSLSQHHAHHVLHLPYSW